MLADKMAKSVLKEDRSNSHRLMKMLGRFYSRQKQLLRQFLRVIVQVDILRQEALEKREGKELSRQLAYAPDLAHCIITDGLRVFLQQFQMRCFHRSFRVQVLYFLF